MRHRPVMYGLAVVFLMSLPILVMFVAQAVVAPYGRYVQSSDKVRDEHVKVGMVLGAGITDDGKPFRELRARLDVAAEGLRRGDVDKLILSGDNRFASYDEPTAMMKYLTDVKGVSADKLQRDFAGRSTYESCQRAHDVFGQSRLVVYSAGSHLPRAIYLCRHFGIEAYGVASGVEANNAGRREPLARIKALYNVHVRGENTILGSPVKL